MVLHVKDDETDELVRQLARLRGIGITAAIKEAVRETIARDRAQAAAAKTVSLDQKLRPLFDRLDRLPRQGPKTNNALFDKLWNDEGK